VPFLKFEVQATVLIELMPKGPNIFGFPNTALLSGDEGLDDDYHSANQKGIALVGWRRPSPVLGSPPAILEVFVEGHPFSLANAASIAIDVEEEEAKAPSFRVELIAHVSLQSP